MNFSLKKMMTVLYLYRLPNEDMFLYELVDTYYIKLANYL